MARPTRTVDDQLKALRHVGYEFDMAAIFALRLHQEAARDNWESNAYLEACLIHVRSLYEFLCSPLKQPKDDDIIRTDFADMWTPPVEVKEQLLIEVTAMHKYVAHLSWTRLDETDAPPDVAREWPVGDAVLNTAVLLRAWAEHLRDTGPDELHASAQALHDAAEQVLNF